MQCDVRGCGSSEDVKNIFQEATQKQKSRPKKRRLFYLSPGKKFRHTIIHNNVRSPKWPRKP